MAAANARAACDACRVAASHTTDGGARRIGSATPEAARTATTESATTGAPTTKSPTTRSAARTSKAPRAGSSGGGSWIAAEAAGADRFPWWRTEAPRAAAAMAGAETAGPVPGRPHVDVEAARARRPVRKAPAAGGPVAGERAVDAARRRTAPARGAAVVDPEMLHRETAVRGQSGGEDGAHAAAPGQVDIRNARHPKTRAEADRASAAPDIGFDGHALQAGIERDVPCLRPDDR